MLIIRSIVVRYNLYMAEVYFIIKKNFSINDIRQVGQMQKLHGPYTTFDVRCVFDEEHQILCNSLIPAFDFVCLIHILHSITFLFLISAPSRSLALSCEPFLQFEYGVYCNGLTLELL